MFCYVFWGYLGTHLAKFGPKSGLKGVKILNYAIFPGTTNL